MWAAVPRMEIGDRNFEIKIDSVWECGRAAAAGPEGKRSLELEAQ